MGEERCATPEANFGGDMLLIFYEYQEPPRVPSLSLTQAPKLTASIWRQSSHC